MRKLACTAALVMLASACGPAAGPAAQLAAPAVATDDALAAVQRAQVQACPTDRVQSSARSEGFGAFQGVTIEDVANVPMSGAPARTLALQRVTVAPGGIIGWHAHDGGQGMALLVSGRVTEARNDCLDMIAFEPGDVTLESADTIHSFRNDGVDPAVFLVWSGAPISAAQP